MGRVRPLSPTGTLAALLLGAACLSPSLLPRPAVMVGVVAGLGAGIGYALGTAIEWLFRRLTRRCGPARPPRRVWVALLGVGALAALAMSWLDHGWQRQLHTAAGMTPGGWEWFPISLGVAAAVWLVLLGIGRTVRLAFGWLDRRLSRAAPAPAVRVAIWTAFAAAAALMLLTGVVGAVFHRVAAAAFASYDAGTDTGVTAPTSRLVSGGPGSGIPWDELGRGGRSFVSATPSAGALRDFAGQLTPAAAGQVREPIRVFVGMDSANQPEARAQLAVAELERMGAFQRKVLLIANSAGSGIVDESGVRPIEFMYGGDTAVVSQQYSYLPSWLSFLVDQQASADAGRALYEAVRARWEQLPPDSRPRLVVFGESLGAYSGQAAFTDPRELAAGVDGALFAGSPAASPLHQRLTAQRQAGSPTRLPVFDDGRHIRFAAAPTDFASPKTPWQQARVGYLQNATDPVVWWSPRLLWSRPGWLAEPRGIGVSPALRWFPLVTFLEVSGDMINSTSVPYGFGHVYGPNEASAWAEILPPPGWTAKDTQELRTAS